MDDGARLGWSLQSRRLLACVAGALAIVLLAQGAQWQKVETAAPELVVDPNTAPPEVLASLPRLGPARVAAIVSSRQQAPFRSLDDLDARVKGIGPSTIKAIRPYLRIEADPPAHPTP
jgi:competence protein ComEA